MATISIQREQTNPKGNPKLGGEKQSRVNIQEGHKQIQNTQFKTKVYSRGFSEDATEKE